MSETTTVEIPLEQFDLALLPESARHVGTEGFRDAVSTFFQEELHPSAEWIQVGVDNKSIRVSWRAKSAAPDPFEQAIEQLRAGDYQKGIRLLRLLLRVRPDDPGILQNLGMALSDQGQLDDAIQLLQRAVELNPESGNTQVALGVAYSRQGNTSESLRALERAVQLQPDNPYALRGLAGCLLKLGTDLPRAERCFQQAVAALPDDQNSWLGLGHVLAAEERLNEADKAFRRVLAINPSNQLAETAKQALSAIAQRNTRAAVGGGLRMDAVMYLLGRARNNRPNVGERSPEACFGDRHRWNERDQPERLDQALPAQIAPRRAFWPAVAQLFLRHLEALSARDRHRVRSQQGIRRSTSHAEKTLKRKASTCAF